MPLAADGVMSIGGSTSTRSINLELGRAAGATSSLGETALRTLAGVSSGAISISNFYGKSNITVSLSSVTSNEPFEAQALAPGESVFVTLDFNSDGTWDATLEAFGSVDGNWATPTTTGIGSSYWIRFTRTFFSGGFGNSATGSTGWLQLTSGQGLQVYNSGTDSIVTADYTIEISTNSSGTNIIATASLVTLNALLFGA
jgi:hypothetical protein